MRRVGTGRASGLKPSQMFSMRVVSAFILDRLRPGITTTVTSDWEPRATGGHATWMQRRGGKLRKREKQRNEERKKAKKIKLRVATLNVGTTTVKRKRSSGPYGAKRAGHIVCAGNSLEGGESKMHRWRI